MAAVHGSGNSVVLDVVQEDPNNELGDAAGNRSIEIEEDSGNLRDADVNSIDKNLFFEAMKGNFDAFEKSNVGSLRQLVTRVERNTILHICVTAATPHYPKREKTGIFSFLPKITARTENNKSIDFVNKALATCKELLWQPNKKGETILHIAARYGHHDIVQVLLTEDKEARRNGQAVNRPQRLLEMKNKAGDTALHEAVRYSHLQVVKILVNEDRNYQYGQNNDGETPLYIAAEMEARDVVQEILTCESPAYQGPYGRTALHAAVLCHNNGIVKLLLARFKKLITRKADNSSSTPLHYAAQEGCDSIVKMLLEEDENAAYMGNKDKKTALHVAASKGKATVVWEFMLTCPDCFEQVDKNGQNVLHLAVEATDGKRRETLRLILGNDCFSNLINTKDNSSDTPLHHLVKFDNPRALDLVFHPKLNARVFNKKHLSPLEVIFPLKSEASIWTVLTSIALRNVGKTPSRQITEEDKGKEGGGIKDQDGINEDVSDQEKKDVLKKARNSREFIYDYKYLKDINLLIAILVATVTFAAGFTIPGGYTSDDKKPNEAGYPVLIRKPAFIMFVFSNTIAFVLASSGVFLHLSWKLYTRVTIFASEMSLLCNFVALIAMAVAFVSGTCAVLAPNPFLVAAICVLSALLFAFTCSSQILGFLIFFARIKWISVFLWFRFDGKQWN